MMQHYRRHLLLLLFLFVATTVQAQHVHGRYKPKPEKVYDYVEEMPKFQGDLTSYLANHIRYPDVSEEEFQGRIIVQFIVRKDGSVGNIEIIRSGSAAFNAEAKRVVKNMPRWTPGKQNGKPVAVRFTLPIILDPE